MADQKEEKKKEESPAQSKLGSLKTKIILRTIFGILPIAILGAGIFLKLSLIVMMMAMIPSLAVAFLVYMITKDRIKELKAELGLKN